MRKKECYAILQNMGTVISVIFLLCSITISTHVIANEAGMHDNDGQPFQVMINAIWEEGYLTAVSDPYEFGANETAVLQYISCQVNQGMFGLAPADIELSINIEGGLRESQVLLFTELEDWSPQTPSPIHHPKGVTRFISGCVGRKCESFGDERYASLQITAHRGISADELLENVLYCLISGYLY